MVSTSPIPMVLPAWQHRISVERYHRMVDADVFDEGDRIELLEGFIVAMSPQDPSHAWAVSTLTERLARQLPPSARLRVQLPLTLAASEPEPDLAVVARDEERSAQRHPRGALLVVEVARESLERDRQVKAGVYAAAGIPEYWIVNLADRCVEVHRDPTPGVANYATHARLIEGETVQATAVEGVTIAVAELFRA